ncbi:hypothetical protein CO154_02110, partial [Candidatus Pacearchaeota archaeon CG_4_9_14_3_um_filter_31_7]
GRSYCCHHLPEIPAKPAKSAKLPLFKKAEKEAASLGVHYFNGLPRSPASFCCPTYFYPQESLAGRSCFSFSWTENLVRMGIFCKSVGLAMSEISIP